MYPHVHLIPRRTGDMEDPRGGVRHVIPEKGNYHQVPQAIKEYYEFVAKQERFDF